LACMLVLAAVSDAHAQDTRLMDRLDPRTAAAATELADSARALTLPTEPLVQEALEGQGKGACGDALIHAGRRLIHDRRGPRGARRRCRRRRTAPRRRRARRWRYAAAPRTAADPPVPRGIRQRPGGDGLPNVPRRIRGAVARPHHGDVERAPLRGRIRRATTT